MKYNFKVNPEVFKIFVNEATNEDIEKLKREFQEFRIKYNTELDMNNPYSLLELLNAESDNQQILMVGIKSNNEETLAYWFVGDGELEDEKEDYKLALEAFEKMKKYEIK
ncbi:hypothetical protein K144316041_p21500 (plasmid) [Clostridium tetani]|uniref:hypothetical protein n=1 Tax=Clostridium tetani TaxID=1513 RepID=UPI002952AE6E|nr:hypothetical protein [Clostridium tetani]BDR74311.1 hypothetical protein K144316041_p21500 [Clostridium tetani]